MICIRQDLIDKELSYFKDRGKFTKLKLSNHFIDWLFRHYCTVEFSEHYYDDEPDIPSEWKDNYSFENPDFLKIWNKLVEEYEPKRIEFNNWIEPHFKGNWGVSQVIVDKVSRNAFREVRNAPVKKKDRLYISYSGDCIHIYWYGRDFMQLDYWWIMQKKRMCRK